MNYEQVREKALKSRWKTEVCASGEECWCRIITTETPLVYSEKEEYYIVGEAGIPKMEAEHIVELHNKSLIRGEKR